MKITNEMLAQYLSNKSLIKELETINETIQIGIKANGGASTEQFTAIVEDCERQSVAPKKDFDIKMGPGWLEKQGLLKVSQFQKVTVVEKQKKVGVS